MAERVEIEKLLTEVRRQRDDAEARATTAADSLVRLASRLKPLPDVDPEQVEAAADEFGAAVRELKLLDGFARELRKLLM